MHMVPVVLLFVFYSGRITAKMLLFKACFKEDRI